MRDMKCRAWDPLKKIMLYGDNIPIEWHTDDGESRKLLSKVRPENGDYYENIIMRYTWLKDNNGVEIYEGDILDSLGTTGWLVVVEWQQVWLRMWFNVNKVATWIVRGNIYENPELLSDK